MGSSPCVDRQTFRCRRWFIYDILTKKHHFLNLFPLFGYPRIAFHFFHRLHPDHYRCETVVRGEEIHSFLHLCCLLFSCWSNYLKDLLIVVDAFERYVDRNCVWGITAQDDRTMSRQIERGFFSPINMKTHLTIYMVNGECVIDGRKHRTIGRDTLAWNLSSRHKYFARAHQLTSDIRLYRIRYAVENIDLCSMFFRAKHLINERDES